MNNDERGSGRPGRSVLAAGFLVALLLLDFPQGVPGAVAQEPLGEPSELDEEDDRIPAKAPAVSDTNEEDDEESRAQPGDAPCDQVPKDAAPDPSPLSEDDDEASPAAIDDSESSGGEDIPDEFD